MPGHVTSRHRTSAAVALGRVAARAAVPAARAAVPAARAASGRSGGPADPTVSITVLGTSDLHGYIENWDYFTDAEYDDAAHNDVGLAKIATLAGQVRADRGEDSTLLVDAGDTIQGTPLTDYFATVASVADTGETHPMAAAMNAMGYAATTLGNHDLNYGVRLLRAFERQLDFPLLGANVKDWRTGEDAFPPYVLQTVRIEGQEPVTVGILGLTTPGSAIWDRNNVEGELRFLDMVDQAQKYVPEMTAAGADVVLVSAHSGPSGTSSYGGGVPVENASTLIAEQVPGIDAILAGHEHLEIPERFVLNRRTGRRVLLTEPKNWGQRLSVLQFELTRVRDRWVVASATSELLDTSTVAADPRISAITAEQHQRVLDHVNTPVGTATGTMSAAESCIRDTAVMDFVATVQAEAVGKALEGTAAADLPVLSVVAPFNRSAVIPEGPVTIRDVAGLYVFPNTLVGVELTGAQVRDYLEYSAKYFHQVAPGAPVDPTTLTNAADIPDYDYDMMTGVSYDIDISRPVGQRITGLSYDGAPIDPAQRFAVATNNYRQSGGGDFPHIASAPVLVDSTTGIRQLLIDHLTTEGTIDPDGFLEENWRLTRNGHPLFR